MTDAREHTSIGLPGIAWAVYDFGYALFAFVVFARYLSDWLITDLGHPDWVYTTTQLLAAVALLLVMPLSGVVADVLGRHKPLLALYTCLAGGSAILIGLIDPDLGAFGVLPIVTLAGVSAASTALAFAQFDPMLAAVAPVRQWGLMSGIAAGAGYLGMVAWLVLLAERVVGEGDKQQAFPVAALLYLACAAPLLVLVPERTRPPSVAGIRSGRDALRSAGGQLRAALGRLRQHRDITRLLIGRLLYADAIGTVNIFAIVYISRLGHFSEAEKDQVVLVVVTSAALGAVAAGWIARRIGPRRVLLGVIPVFSLGVTVVALAGTPWTVWLIAPVLGVSLGTVAAVDRVFMLALTPDHLRGELFGFFNLIGRVAQALGPFVLWGGTILVLHDLTDWLTALDASRVSFVLLAAAALIGLRVVAPLDDGYRR